MNLTLFLLTKDVKDAALKGYQVTMNVEAVSAMTMPGVLSSLLSTRLGFI